MGTLCFNTMAMAENNNTGLDSFCGQIWSLRHGQACHNVSKDDGQPEAVWFNMLDPQLTEKGYQDAAKCVLPNLTNPIFLCSPLKRTLATAIGIVKNHGGRIVAHPALQESHNADRPGDPRRLCDTGTPLSELSELPWESEVDFSLCCENWMDDARTVEQRVPEVLRWLKLNSNPNQDIVMVTHNGVLRRLLGVVDAPHCEAKLLEGFVEDFVRAKSVEGFVHRALANTSQAISADLERVRSFPFTVEASHRRGRVVNRAETK